MVRASGLGAGTNPQNECKVTGKEAAMPKTEPAGPGDPSSTFSARHPSTTRSGKSVAPPRAGPSTLPPPYPALRGIPGGDSGFGAGGPSTRGHRPGPGVPRPHPPRSQLRPDARAYLSTGALRAVAEGVPMLAGFVRKRFGDAPHTRKCMRQCLLSTWN